MTNTLILAFLGSGFTLIIYIYSLGLPWHELASSTFLALEVVSGVSSAIGVILAVPVTAENQGLCFSAKMPKALNKTIKTAGQDRPAVFYKGKITNSYAPSSQSSQSVNQIP